VFIFADVVVLDFTLMSTIWTTLSYHGRNAKETGTRVHRRIL
jgi:hypothetical protein